MDGPAPCAVNGSGRVGITPHRKTEEGRNAVEQANIYVRSTNIMFVGFRVPNNLALTRILQWSAQVQSHCDIAQYTVTGPSAAGLMPQVCVPESYYSHAWWFAPTGTTW
jgi:hypothetical protein